MLCEFQNLLEQQTAGTASQSFADMDFDTLPGSQQNFEEGSDDDLETRAGIEGLECLAHSPPARRHSSMSHPAAGSASQGRRVTFQSDRETFQAGATLTDLGAVAHGPRASLNTLTAAGPSADKAQQQADQPKKKRGRPKGTKNKPKDPATIQQAAAVEASSPMPGADSAVMAPKPPRPTARSKKTTSGQTPASPSHAAVLEQQPQQQQLQAAAATTKDPETPQLDLLGAMENITSLLTEEFSDENE